MIFRREFLMSVPAGAALAAAPVPLAVGCQQNAWRDPADFDGLLAQLAKIKRLGYDGFETNVRNVHGQFDAAAKARERIHATGLRFIGPHANLQRTKPDELERLAAGSKALGAERIVFSGTVPQAGVEAAIAGLAQALNSAGRRCGELGMRAIYHNHQTEFASNGAPMEALLRQTDPAVVSLLFDIGHAFLRQIDVAGFLEKHHLRIDALHLRDIKAGKQAPLGEGEVDLKGLAAAVRRVGWRGWLIDETELRTPDSSLAERVLASDRKIIRATFAA